MTLKNKWNGRLYELVKENNKTVVLKRYSDNSVFEIDKSEYTFSQKPSDEKKLIEK